ncbi:MAG: hypothetical protein WCJ31_16935 [Planctomycetia bacterium]
MPCFVGCRGWLSLPSVPAAGMVWGSIALAVAVALTGEGARLARGADVDGFATLSLPGGTLTGRLVEAPPPAEGASPTIRWQSPAFAGPFEFPLEQVDGISFDRQPEELGAARVGRWQVELADGDSIIGRLDSIDETSIGMTIGSAEAPIGIAVNRDAVRRISTGSGQSPSVWDVRLDRVRTSAEAHWRRHAGGIASTTPGATIRFDAGAGDRMRYDLTLAWEEPPRVRLGFGEFRRVRANGPGVECPVDMASRIELTAEGVIVIRDEARPEGTGHADLVTCGPVPDKGLSLSVFIDRKAGRIVVVRPGEGPPLADLSIEPIAIDPARVGVGWESVGNGLQIDLISGGVVLERLRMSPWRGNLSGPVDDRLTVVELLDGNAIAGRVSGLADDGRALVVVPEGAIGASPQTIPLDTVAAIRFPAAAALPADPDGASNRRVQISDRFGSSLRGDLVGIAEERVTITHAAIDAPVSLPLNLLEGVAPMRSAPDDRPLPGRVGRLELEGEVHDGCLVPIAADGAEAGWGAIGWLPRGSLIAAPFAPAADGSAPRATIRYDESAPDDGGDDQNGWIGVTIGEVGGKAMITEVFPGGPLHQSIGLVPPAHLRAVAPRGDGVFVATKGLPIDDVMDLVQGRAGTEVQLQIAQGALSIRSNVSLVRGLHPIWGRDRQRLRKVLAAQERLLARKTKRGGETESDRFRSIVILETGESVKGCVESIGEGGVRLLREGAEPVEIPPGEIKAVELVPQWGSLMSAEKFRSLTTLPRSQRHLPPTHLVRSMQGDYLRGRLAGMDGENLRIAVDADPRGKPVSIPRQDVARVIWLHPESLDDAWQPLAAALAPGLPVEAVAGRGERLRMAATGIEGSVLIGSHAILGASRIDLDSIDRLLIGGVLEETPKRLPYAQWQLQPAAEPRNLPKKQPAKP